MKTGGRLRIIKGVLYRLKRSFGCPLSVYRQGPDSIDLTTGKTTGSRQSVEIRAAIVLPSKVHRGFTYDIGFLKANSNFTYGGLYTDALRLVIIERSDLPKDWVLDSTDEWYIVYQGRRWQLKTVEEYEFNYAYFMTLTRVDGAIVNEIKNINVTDRLNFDESLGEVGPPLDIVPVVDVLQFEQTVTVAPIVHNQTVFESLAFMEDSSEQL